MADELDIIAFRRALHRRPELSFRETGTHDLIARTLDGLGIAHRTVARTGVLARIEGRGNLRRSSCAPTLTRCRSANRPTWRGARSTTG